MRINTNLEEYNIGSLSHIYETICELKEVIKMLEESGHYIKRCAIAISDIFDDINYKRTVAAIDSYLSKMNVTNEEMDELLKSCIELAEKISEIWA